MTNKLTTYSLKKEIGLFFLIWPIGPIVILVLSYLIEYLIALLFHAVFSPAMMLTSFAMLWLTFGWIVALGIYFNRRKKYFKNDDLAYKKQNKVMNFIPVVFVLAAFGCVVYLISTLSFDFSGHRDAAPSGAKIRLEISEDECRQYPNRYYFKNLCILCPDEQPLVDGHCQPCPKGELVLSDGCRSCDSDWNYITPKIECDACPNRIYEDGLCKLAYHTQRKWCEDNQPWKGTKEECAACEHRRYTEDGLCHLYYHGWSVGDPQAEYRGIRADKYYENNEHLGSRYFDKNNQLIREEYYKYERGANWTRRIPYKYTTYFKNGLLRTDVDLDYMKGYYKSGVLALKKDEKEVFLYTPTGDVLAEIILHRLVKNDRCWHSGDYVIEKAFVKTKEGLQNISDSDLFQYLQSHYSVDFELPFIFQIHNGKYYDCKKMNKALEEQYVPNELLNMMSPMNYWLDKR